MNDSVAHADELAAFLRTVGPAARLHVNLIPYNAQSSPAFAPPSHEACKAFKTALQAAGLFVKIRFEKGADKMAACGQLGNVRLRRELNARRFAASAAAEEQEARRQQQQQADETQHVDEDGHEAAVAAAAQQQQHRVMPLASFAGGEAVSRICGQKDLEW